MMLSTNMTIMGGFTMDISKHLDFLNPKEYKKTIHIIGVGAVGSRIAEQIARLGFSDIKIYDFDTVESVNIANQLFTHQDIGKTKVDAVERHMKEINPNIEVVKQASGWRGQPLNGTVFIAVDSIELRHQIVSENMFNKAIDVIFDGRMRLTDAQYFGAVWENEKERSILLSSMSFSEEEADIGTPLSSCGTTLSVVPTVVSVSSLMVANFINFLNNEDVQNLVLVDPFTGSMNAIKY